MLNYKNFKIINEDINNPKLNKAAANKMRQCVTSLTLNYGFFADLLLSLKIMETKQYHAASFLVIFRTDRISPISFFSIQIPP